MTRSANITSPADVCAALIGRREIALLDVRDEQAFAEAHPLFAASLPLGRLDLEIFDRVPRAGTPIVVYDDGEGIAERAATRLSELGYQAISLLADGVRGWRAAGGELFRDVNVPSKAFGELVEARRHTPSIAAEDLYRLLDTGADLVVLDARRFDEYQTMNIPSSISVPGGELVYRAGDLAPRPETLVVVNCAGRTRSIIGAQSLLNAGIPNRVVALRNGTIGWTLAQLTLERHQSRQAPPPGAESVARARVAARDVAERAGVLRVGVSRLATWEQDISRTLYRFDVRSLDEYAAGHRPGFRPAPGGQLVQETDVFAPVRGARIVLADNDGVRADMTASWLAQMGWEVSVLESGLADAPLETGPWRPAVLRGTADMTPRGDANRANRNVYKRPYEGTNNPASAMQAYLEWEYGLVAQLERDGTHGFFVLPAAGSPAKSSCVDGDEAFPLQVW